MIANPIVRIDGVLSTGSEESLNMLMWNCIGGAVLIAWNLIMSIIHFMILDRLGVLRVSPADEIQGLDVIKHNEKSYGFGTGRATSMIPNPYNEPDPPTHLLTVSTLLKNKVEPMGTNII